jgi:hypothetical protein
MATDYQTAVVTLAGVPVPLQLFNGRPKRRTLVIAGATAGTTSVATSGGNFNGTIFARLAAGTTLVMYWQVYQDSHQTGNARRNVNRCDTCKQTARWNLDFSKLC